MTDDEKFNIETKMSTTVIPLLRQMFKAKKINATLTGASTDTRFLHIDFKIDYPTVPEAIQISLGLLKDILYDIDYCWELEIAAGIMGKNIDIIDRINLRVLWIAYDTVKKVVQGTYENYLKYQNKILVTFQNESGKLFVRNDSR